MKTTKILLLFTISILLQLSSSASEKQNEILKRSELPVEESRSEESRHNISFPLERTKRQIGYGGYYNPYYYPLPLPIIIGGGFYGGRFGGRGFGGLGFGGRGFGGRGFGGRGFGGFGGRGFGGFGGRGIGGFGGRGRG